VRYRVGRCTHKNRCPGESLNANWQIVAVTTGTSVTVEPPEGLSDYGVFAEMPNGSDKMLPLRVTVTR
jgi:hypothetical protein